MLLLMLALCVKKNGNLRKNRKLKALLCVQNEPLRLSRSNAYGTVLRLGFKFRSDIRLLLPR